VQDRYRTRGYGTSAVFERGSGRFIGYCGVVRALGNDFDELVYVFDREAWGRGYATEVGAAMLAHVFERSELDRIWATIDAENEPSLRVAAKLGFDRDRVETTDGVPVVYLAVDRPA
jgi:RimJ/RimL family protein N-acetyltransferase